jgi:single-strand DNA-binding protein
MYLNKVIIGGNLTRDPEKRALPNGTAVTNFSLATNRIWKDQNGKTQEQADYHNIVVFGRPAETSAQYLTKGQFVLVEGRLQTRSWDDKDGSKKYRTEIIADRVQFGAKNSGGGSGSAPSEGQDDGSPAPASSQQDNGPSDDSIEYPEEEINPEDIPF